jgi:hypothetical protein
VAFVCGRRSARDRWTTLIGWTGTPG